MKPIRLRAIFLFVLTMLAIYSIAPTVIYFLQPLNVRNDDAEFKKHLPSWLPQKHIVLGLDLQGGVQLALGVSTEGAIENRLNRAAVEISRWSKDNNFSVENSYVAKDRMVVVVKLKEDQDEGSFYEALHKDFPYLVKIRKEAAGLEFGYSEKEKDRIKQSALEQAERVVRARVDAWGVSEPHIARRANGDILVQLPGFRNPQRAKELLGRTAQLKFKIVDDQFNGFASLKGKTHPEGITETTNGGQIAFNSENREALTAYLKALVPEDHQLLFAREQLGQGAKSHNRWTSYVVMAATEITGDDIQDAQMIPGTQMDPSPFVQLKMNNTGAKRFAEVTGENVHKRLAIVLDDVVEFAPQISERIPGGTAQIKLGGGRAYNDVMEEGNSLSMILKSGAIPATIQVLEERAVGASLGPELANQGIKGALLGLLAVFLFMLIYYRRPGLIACIALCMNAVFLLAVMAMFGFALTLPGIAAFVLSLGMAVDANVLINERIRFELREGLHPKKAVDHGFKRTLWTIIDGHVTTIIAAAILLETNASGPIRGFAVSLIIGLLISLFTSLTCSRFFFDLALLRVADKKIKAWLAGETALQSRNFHFSFLKYSRGICFGLILLSAAVIGTSFVRGGANFGVDFNGGTEMDITFAKDIEAEHIRKVAEEAKISGLSIQAIGGGQKQFLLRYEESKEPGNKAAQTVAASETFNAFKSGLLEKLKEYGPDIQQVGFVGPQVGKELRNQGMLSILYAILAVFLYIALRFDIRFAPGAMIKMFLDIFVLLGFYVFFWRSFDLVSVAALLTVVGYSLNDTVVVYDRIRENVTDHPRRTWAENINLALNETLSRTINTSLATGLSLVGILIFGTGQIWDFAMVMLIGIIIATLSSIFVASGFVLWMDNWRSAKESKQKLNSAMLSKGSK